MHEVVCDERCTNARCSSQPPNREVQLAKMLQKEEQRIEPEQQANSSIPLL